MKRVVSIDIYRAITMLFMLWVNDFAGMAGIPHWLCHAATQEDMMGLSDLVFPSFLFCVGLSLPLAIETRFRKGDSLLQVISHIITRSLALIVMGLFSMNCSGIEGGLNHQWFCIIMIVAYFLIWNIYPQAEGTKKKIFTAMRILGVAILVGLVVYRLANGLPIRPKWWGILGLIGWAYLICGALYLIVRQNISLNVIIWVVLVTCMILVNSGIEFLTFYPGGWTHPVLVYSGVIASMVLGRYSAAKTPLPLIAIFLAITLLMISATHLCHNFWICSKILATPTWAFESLTFFFPILALLFYICDYKGWQKWALPIKPAGTATLTCYLIPTVWYCAQQLIGWTYPEVLRAGGLGLLKSFVLALVFITITGLLGKIHIKLKL